MQQQIEMHRPDEPRPFQADFSVEPAESGVAVVLESRGGRGRNPDYNERLTQILRQLASISAKISDATVESTRAQALAKEQKRLQMPGLTYPIRLRPLQDVAELRFAIGRAQEVVAQAPGASGGNRTKKIRIVVDPPPSSADWSPRDWEAFLSGSQLGELRQDRTPLTLPGEPLLHIITSPEQIATAQETLMQRMRENAEAYGQRSLGFRGGHVDAAVFYQPELDLWMAFGKEPSRFWNAFGFGRPAGAYTGSIVTEINPPVQGINRRTGGAFATDHEGQLYLVHNGNVGGGRPGIGKSQFLSFYRRTVGFLERVKAGDHTDDFVVIGSITDPALPAYVTGFVHTVQEFKLSITSDDRTASLSGLCEPTAYQFSPEFSGRKTYATKERIVAECTHGLIVNSLARLLRERGYRTANDRFRDVMILDADGQPRVLFEVKPSSDSYSIYAAIGQLFFHTALMPEIRRIAVLPESSAHDVRSRLAALGIGFVGFDWAGQRLRFHGLKDVAGLL